MIERSRLNHISANQYKLRKHGAPGGVAHISSALLDDVCENESKRKDAHPDRSGYAPPSPEKVLKAIQEGLQN